MDCDNNKIIKEIKNMYKYINTFNKELNKDSKIIIFDKIKTLQDQRSYQINLINKLNKKIKKLKNGLIIKKNFWNIIVFESCDTTIQEFDSLILPISKNIKNTENDMNESISMLIEAKKIISQIDYLYRYINWFFYNNFY